MQRSSFFKRSPTSATKIILLLRASNTPWFDTNQQPIYPLSDTISTFGCFDDVTIYAHPYSPSKVTLAPLSKFQSLFSFLGWIDKVFSRISYSKNYFIFFHLFLYVLHGRCCIIGSYPIRFECKFTRLLGLSSKLKVVDLQHGNINPSVPYYSPALIESANTFYAVTTQQALTYLAQYTSPSKLLYLPCPQISPKEYIKPEYDIIYTCQTGLVHHHCSRTTHTQSNISDLFAEFLDLASSNKLSLKCLVRPHPRSFQNNEIYDIIKHIKKMSALEHHIDLSQSDIYHDLSRSELHFTYGSSCSNIAFENGVFTLFMSYDFLPGNIYQDFYAHILQSGLGRCFNSASSIFDHFTNLSREALGNRGIRSS